MRRFYVVKKSVLYEHIEGRGVPYHDLFVSAGGAHYIDLDGVHILLCCEEFRRADDETTWHAHPEVARVHHADHTGPLKTLLHVDNSHKQFSDKHVEALKSIGVTGDHTVQDLSDIASKIHPLVCLRDKY